MKYVVDKMSTFTLEEVPHPLTWTTSSLCSPQPPLFRIFQKILSSRGEIPPPVRGRMGHFARDFFYQVVGVWGAILTIQAFFKAKNNVL